VNIIYDHTAGFVATPNGIGKYVQYNPETGTVIVEMDYSYLVEFSGAECYPLPERPKRRQGHNMRELSEFPSAHLGKSNSANCPTYEAETPHETWTRGWRAGKKWACERVLEYIHGPGDKSTEEIVQFINLIRTLGQEEQKGGDPEDEPDLPEL